MKPVEGYKIVDLFGRSILTQEGQEWKRHRKIVGPSFSEKSNRLVFEESLRQTEGMMGLWASQQKSLKGELKVKNTAVDAAILSLHVICAAGFGVPQLWPQETEEKLVGNGVPGFSEHEVKGAHTLTFKYALNSLLKNLMWFVMLPRSVLSKYSLASREKDILTSNRNVPFQGPSINIPVIYRMYGIFPRAYGPQEEADVSWRE